MRTVKPASFLQKTSNVLIWILLLISSLLWLSSYTYHTAIGIDHDFERQDSILHKYYRINWTGHGSVWIGYGSQIKPHNPEQSLEKFDLAAAFFHRQDKPLQNTNQTFWNKLGFWYINSSQPKPVFWLGIPSWMPVLLLGFILFAQMRQNQRNA